MGRRKNSDRHRRPAHRITRNRASSGNMGERRYNQTIAPSFAAHIRACCPTDDRYEEHMPTCQRDLRGCRDKRAFGSKMRAQAVAEVMAVVHREPFDAYRCDDCQRWHVGRPAKRRRPV